MKKILTLVGVSLLSVVAACKSDGDGGGNKGGSGGGNQGGSAGDGAGGSAGDTGGGTGGKATGGTGGKAAGGMGGTVTGGAGGTVVGGTGGTVVGGTGGTAVTFPVGSLAAKLCSATTVYPAPFAPAGMDATLVREGFKGAEGPVWVDADKALYFSEMNRANGVDWALAASVSIQKYTPADNMFTVWVAASGSNGLALDKDGNILAATQDQQDISVFKLSDKSRTNKGFLIAGQKFSAPNDLTMRSDGTIYFSDPAWQIGNRTPNQGVAAYRANPAGVVSVVEDNFNALLQRPNGITLSPDEKTLYIGGEGKNIYKYEVNTDGSTKAGVKFAVLVGGFSDGMGVDCAGNLYVTSNKGVEVFDKTGKAIGTILTKKGAEACSASNVAFGGDDHKTLFITVEGCTDFKAIFKATLAVPGMPY